MFKRLIRWLALDEIARAQDEMLRRVQTNHEHVVYQAYCNGFSAGRAIGQGETIAHLRGSDERVTEDLMAERANRMVN